MFPIYRNIKQVIRQTTTIISGGLASLVFIHIISSCSSCHEEGLTYGEVNFSTQWKSQSTRSTVDNQWSDGDTVQISMYNTTRRYKAQSNGMLTAVDKAFYWASKTPTQVSGIYSPMQPFADDNTFTIETEQNNDNGFNRSDVLYAKPVTVKYGETALLSFCHMTALVYLNVSHSADLGSINMTEADIKFVNQHNVSGNVDMATGAVSQRTLQPTSCQITPASATGSNAEVKRVRTLLIPQYGYGYPIITVSFTDANTKETTTYTYTPTKTAPINLEAGKQYTINVILTRSDGGSIKLISVSEATWNTITETIESDDRKYNPTPSSPTWNTTTDHVIPTERK